MPFGAVMRDQSCGSTPAALMMCSTSEIDRLVSCVSRLSACSCSAEAACIRFSVSVSFAAMVSRSCSADCRAAWAWSSIWRAAANARSSSFARLWPSRHPARAACFDPREARRSSPDHRRQHSAPQSAAVANSWHRAAERPLPRAVLPARTGSGGRPIPFRARRGRRVHGCGRCLRAARRRVAARRAGGLELLLLELGLGQVREVGAGCRKRPGDADRKDAGNEHLGIGREADRPDRFLLPHDDLALGKPALAERAGQAANSLMAARALIAGPSPPSRRCRPTAAAPRRRACSQQARPARSSRRQVERYEGSIGSTAVRPFNASLSHGDRRTMRHDH